MSSLVKDNKVLVIKLHQTSKENSNLKRHDSGSNGGHSPSHDFSAARDRNEKESGFSEKVVDAVVFLLP